MVRLYEYQAKEIFKKYEIKIPRGILISDENIDIASIINSIKPPYVVKAQVLHGKRGLKGLVKTSLAETQLRKNISELIEYLKLHHEHPRILVEEYIKEKIREYYLSITISNSYKIKGPILLFGEGGINIEEKPEKVIRIPIDYLEGPNKELITKKIKPTINPENFDQLLEIIYKVYKIFVDYDCRVVEINPLAYSDKGYIALDARISIDDNSLFRHPEFSHLIPIEMDREPTKLERLAYEIERNDYRGVSYLIEHSHKGDGPLIGFHGIGGGGALIGLDALLKHGFAVANYSDTSGNPPSSKIYRIAKLILSIPNIKAYVLISPNIANQEMWYTAFGLIKAFREELTMRKGFPVAILWGGNKASEATRIILEKTKDLPIRLRIYTVDPVVGPYEDIYSNIDRLAIELKGMLDESN